jgi:hypothetical protein
MGFQPPYPEDHSEGWMVRELCPGAIEKHAPGKVKYAKSTHRPEYWQAPPNVRNKERVESKFKVEVNSNVRRQIFHWSL